MGPHNKVSKFLTNKLNEFSARYPGCWRAFDEEIDGQELPEGLTLTNENAVRVMHRVFRPENAMSISEEIAEMKGMDAEEVYHLISTHADKSLCDLAVTLIHRDENFLQTFYLWRIQQTIYHFSEELVNIIIATEQMNERFGLEPLVHLKERCIFISFPSPFEDNGGFEGFFCHPKMWKNEEGLYVIAIAIIIFGEKHRPYNFVLDLSKGPSIADASGETDEQRLSIIRYCLQLALHTQNLPFMLLQNSETGREHKQMRTVAVKTKRVKRYFPASKPTIINVGYKEGSRPGLVVPSTPASGNIGTGRRVGHEYKVDGFPSHRWVGSGEDRYLKKVWVEPHIRCKGRVADQPTLKKL